MASYHNDQQQQLIGMAKQLRTELLVLNNNDQGIVDHFEARLDNIDNKISDVVDHFEARISVLESYIQ